MRVILVGPPGSGKGTQGKLLSERLCLALIGTGDILREAVRLGTPAGQLAEPYLSHGKLVPDAVVNELVADRFTRKDRPHRFLMDGYPRTLAQAVTFDQVLAQQHLDISAVLLFLVHDDEIVRRLSGRWSCPNPTCQATYHVTKKPPRVAGVCDLCGTALVQREDDREETIRRRLRVYHQNTVELVPYYRAQGLLHEVRAEGSIGDIFATIIAALNPPLDPC